MKYLRIGFYQPHVVNDPATTFEGILRNCATIPNDENRTSDQRDGPVRLQNVRFGMSLWHGDMMRLRMHEDLRKGSRNGGREPIVFGPDEGLGEDTAFIYHPATNTVVIHEQRGAVSVGMFATYFKTFGNVNAVEMQPLLKPHVMERVQRMSRIRTFEVQLGAVQDGRVYRDRDASARTLFEAAAHFGAPKAYIKLEIPKRRRRNDADLPTLRHVVDAARDLFSHAESDSIQKLVIGGEEGGEQVEAVVNLLEDRLVEFVPLDLRPGERITDATRFSAVTTAWNTHHEAIERVYASRS